MATVKNMTLGEFERTFGINKGTVSKAAREAGYDTSKGLTPEAVDAMKRKFGVSALALRTEPQRVDIEVLDPLSNFETVVDLRGSVRYTHDDDTLKVDESFDRLLELQSQSQSNTNAGLSALIEQRRNRGRKLGSVLAQVEISEALRENERQVQAFLKGEGLGKSQPEGEPGVS